MHFLEISDSRRNNLVTLQINPELSALLSRNGLNTPFTPTIDTNSNVLKKTIFPKLEDLNIDIDSILRESFLKFSYGYSFNANEFKEVVKILKLIVNENTRLEAFGFITSRIMRSQFSESEVIDLRVKTFKQFIRFAKKDPANQVAVSSLQSDLLILT